jgi:hypothetical protein
MDTLAYKTACTLPVRTIMRHGSPLASASSRRMIGSLEDLPHPVSPWIIVTRSLCVCVCVCLRDYMLMFVSGILCDSVCVFE